MSAAFPPAKASGGWHNRLYNCFGRILPLALTLGLALLAGRGIAAAPSVAATNESATHTGTLLLCGMDEVFEIDPAAAEAGRVTKLWSWRAKDHDELPEAVRGHFGTTDDCKPVDGGKKVLISSSGGACALVERPSGHVLWYAQAPNAHSLDLVPPARVVVASSTGPNGNRLLLFDLAHSDEPIWSAPMISAHGVVWDEQRHCLWASGSHELRRYGPADWATEKPSLTLLATYTIPDEGAHDLQPVPGSSDLVISTGRHVYLFDREKLEFRPHPELGDTVDVKCVSTHPGTHRIVYLQAQGGEWWGRTLTFLAPAGTATLPDERLYKARWLIEPQ